MWLPYKETINLSAKRTTSGLPLIHSNDIIEERQSNNFQLFCQPELINFWIEMMENGQSPMADMKMQYSDMIPIFNNSFIQCLFVFFQNNNERGAEIIDYLLGGPQQNLELFNWGQLFQFLIFKLPNSLHLLCRMLYMSETSTIHHISIFLQISGLSSLFPFCKNPQYQLSISLALTSLALYDLTSYKSQKKVVSSIVLSNDPSSLSSSMPSSSLSSDFENEESFENDDETSLCQFFEQLLISKDERVRLNTLSSMLSLTEHDIRSRDFISMLILTYLKELKSIDERIFSLKILSISLNVQNFSSSSTNYSIYSDNSNSNSYKNIPARQLQKKHISTCFPYVECIFDITTSFIETTNGNLIDAICAFIEKIMEKDCEEYVLELGIVQKMIAIVISDAPFCVKNNALIITLRITNACSPVNVFLELISPEIINAYIDFLENDNDDIILSILKVIYRICDLHSNRVAFRQMQEILDMIVNANEKFSMLTMSKNGIISILSSKIMTFIQSLE